MSSDDPKESPRLEALIPTVLEKTSQPVWVVDEDGLVLYANPAALAVLGIPDAAQVVGRPSHAMLHPTHPDGSPYPATECRMLEPARLGVPLEGEDWLLDADGRYVPIAWRSAPLELARGRGVIHSFIDLTPRLELEREARERERAELRREELHAAHLRLMEQVAEARRQIARDLHDGAQQRLVALALGSQLLRESAELDGPELALLDGIVADAQAAIDELRRLVAGIHPPVLTSRGLSAAVRTLGDDCALPVVVDDALGGRRLPALIESNAYFLIGEALTNAVKHAGASRLEVHLALVSSPEPRAVDRLEIVVSDDGAGGVDLERAGTGLHSMRDRVQAFDGDFEVYSPTAGGTRIRAQIPVAVTDQASR